MKRISFDFDGNAVSNVQVLDLGSTPSMPVPAPTPPSGDKPWLNPNHPKTFRPCPTGGPGPDEYARFAALNINSNAGARQAFMAQFGMTENMLNLWIQWAGQEQWWKWIGTK